MISGAGDDTVRGGEFLELGAEFGKGGLFVDNVVASDEDEIGRFFLHGGDHFFNEFFIIARPVVEIGEVGDAEAIKRGGPVVQGKVLPGDGKGVGLAEKGPGGGGDSGGEHPEGGAAGEFFQG